MSGKKRLGSIPHHWLDAFFDSGSFLPMNSRVDDADQHQYPGNEVIAGIGRVGNQPVAAYAHDPRVERGFVSVAGAEKICRLMDRAQQHGMPIVAFMSSPGISISEGIASGDAYTRVISRTIAMSGAIPQIAVVIGVTMGAPAYSATLMDFVLFNKVRSHLMVTSPNIVADVLGQQTTLADLGGSDVHAARTGIADFVDANIEQQIQRARALIRLFPPTTSAHAPRITPRAPVRPLPQLPEQDNYGFDMQAVIAGLVDGSEFLLYREEFGRAMLCAFAYVDGNPVGILANNCLHMSGAIDCDAAAKSARFIRLCDAYGVPILTLIDVPGFMPGAQEEQKGLLRYGAQFSAAMQTSVARISVVVRRCYGAAAFLMMQTAAQGGDLVLAVENCKIGIMGFAAAKNVLYQNDPRPDAELKQIYYAQYESPLLALQQGLVDRIVAYAEIRTVVAAHLALAEGKRPLQLVQKQHRIEP